jgi:hypothetical protein
MHQRRFSSVGHAPAAMRVIARLAESRGVRLTIGRMFETRTVAALAGVLAREIAVSKATEEQELAELLAQPEDMSDDQAARLLGNEAKESA